LDDTQAPARTLNYDLKMKTKKAQKVEVGLIL